MDIQENDVLWARRLPLRPEPGPLDIYDYYALAEDEYTQNDVHGMPLDQLLGIEEAMQAENTQWE